MNRTGHNTHAVVLGASISGMLAAQVLTTAFDRVTLVERDSGNGEPTARRGVPQGKHPHLLLGPGAALMDQIFPKILEEFVAHSCVRNRTNIVPWKRDWSLLRPNANDGEPAAEPIYQLTRPELESIMRTRVLASVNALHGHGFDDLMTGSGGEVVGVKLRDLRNQPVLLTADLVVDATGRGSRTPDFLERAGFGRPIDQRMEVNLVYTTQKVRFQSGALDEDLVGARPTPNRPIGISLMRNERDLWLFTVFTMDGVAPPRDLATMVEMVSDFAPQHVVEALGDAELTGPLSRYRFIANQWRRYDRMARFPAGLVVIGDAVATFNPTYGQGMTVAAFQAAALRECLHAGTSNLPQRFFRASAKPIAAAWALTTDGDRSLPWVEDARPWPVRLKSSIRPRLHAAIRSFPGGGGSNQRVARNSRHGRVPEQI